MKLQTAIGLIGLIGLMAGQVMAQLTVTVTPGYVFSAGERPSAATLNELGQPTVSVAGTVSGSVGLAANSVTGVHLADSVPDGSTLDYNGSSPRQLEIKSAGVTKTQLATNTAGAGLSGGAGAALAVQVDGSSITINGANKLTLGTSIAPTNLLYGPVALNGTNVVLNWGAGFTGSLTLTNTTWIDFTNATDGESITLALAQDATGSRTVNWRPTIKWRGGAAPTLTTTGSRTDLVSFLKVGSVYYGSWALNFF